MTHSEAMSRIHKQDVLAGLLLIMVGIFAIVEGVSYDIGTVRRMGPGFFPVMIGTTLLLLGGAISASGFLRTTTQAVLPSGNLRAVFFVTAAIFCFALLIRPAGMIPAVTIAVFVSSLADPAVRPLGALLVAAGMAAIAVVVFIWGLGFQAAPIGRY